VKAGQATVATNIAWGLSWSFRFVLVYSLLAALVYAIAGPPDKSVTLVELVGTYVVLGLLVGIVIGLLRPISRTRAGSTVLGVIVGAVVYVGGGISFFGIAIIREPGPMTAFLIAASIVGGLSGSKWWKNDQNRLTGYR
jgi:hypothetical protein